MKGWNALRKWRDCDNDRITPSLLSLLKLKCPKKMKGLRRYNNLAWRGEDLFKSWNALRKWRDCDLLLSISPMSFPSLCWNALRKWRDCDDPEKPSIHIQSCLLKCPKKMKGLRQEFPKYPSFSSSGWNALRKWRDCDTRGEEPFQMTFSLERWNALRKWRDCDFSQRHTSVTGGQCWNALRKWRDCDTREQAFHLLLYFCWNALRKWRDCDLEYLLPSSFLLLLLKCPKKMKGLRLAPEWSCNCKTIPSGWNALRKWRDCDSGFLGIPRKPSFLLEMP